LDGFLFCFYFFDGINDLKMRLLSVPLLKIEFLKIKSWEWLFFVQFVT